MLNEKPQQKRNTMVSGAWIVVGLIVTGIAVLILISLDSSDPEPVIALNPTTTTASDAAGESTIPAAASGETNVELIQRFLPSGGTASACSEDVGVIVAQGFAAELTINGRTLADNELNVNLNSDGSVANQITATRSRGQYSFTPSDDCPSSGLIRATNNTLEVCVFRLGDAGRRCLAMESFTFNAA